MITLTQAQTKRDIETLWQEVRKTYGPDALVAVLYGGEFVGEVLHEASKIPLYKILIKRPNRQQIYQRLVRWNKFLAWLVYELLFLTDQPKVVEPISAPNNAKLLVVVDGVHTGKTLRECYAALKRFNPKEIRVFAIMDLHKKKLAHYACYREKVSFPWSLDNPNKFSSE